MSSGFMIQGGDIQRWKAKGKGEASESQNQLDSQKNSKCNLGSSRGDLDYFSVFFIA